jgi:hypothetical protein
MGNYSSADPNIPLLNSCRYLSTKGLGVIIGVDENKKLLEQRLGDQYICLVKNDVYNCSLNAMSGGNINQITNCKIFALKEFTYKRTLTLKTLEYKFAEDVFLTFVKGKDFVSFTVSDTKNNVNLTHNMTIKERKEYEDVIRGHSHEFDYIGNFVRTDLQDNYI